MATTKSVKRKTSGKLSAKGRKKSPKMSSRDYKIMVEVTFIVAFALCVLLFLCNFNIIGSVGNAVSRFMFGLLGVLQYIFPIYLFFVIILGMRNMGERNVKARVISLIILFLLICNITDLIGGISKNLSEYSFKELYMYGVDNKKGGGLIAGSFTYLSVKYIGVIGTIIVSIIGSIICIVIASQDAVVNKLKESKDYLETKNENTKEAREEFLKLRQVEREEKKKRDEEKAKAKQEALEIRQAQKTSKEDEKVLRVNKIVSGVTENTLITPKNQEPNKSNMHEITLNDFDVNKGAFISNQIPIAQEPVVDDHISSIKIEKFTPNHDINTFENQISTKNDKSNVSNDKPDVNVEIKQSTVHHKYEFPAISLLTKNKSTSQGDSEEVVRDTARKLIETLEIFGVKAKVDTICQGPTVTRFELLPELGTKVSRIKGLSDDIKLNLATSDIRIEAPIPGKAAVGIEIPNKENQSVLLRDLIDTPEFKKSESNLTFAVGKDISGKVIVYDIDQFPHLLIAGATGSGKSVCINTLIMSLIYKAHPDDVKMIMIDPKVVELSVYNGIPHLLIPVVTDPKKASAALNWAVTEMMERYKKFADMNVRDLKGYNKAVKEKEQTDGPSELYKKLPQIVVIVDELADLIMVAKNEVEDSICRLAQLARACGIHLIIATQRPSVDVITGLIKANMPSRLAFAVSSGIDSRTILDMNGAEELLGKGDMLFYPKGLKKPVRLQGAFVSDSDVNKVVDFLKPQALGNESYAQSIQEKIESSTSSQGSGSNGAISEYDEFFVEAGRYIIQNNKASIGNLQRVYRIGFNRAARIMDKLAEAGVVSGDDGTKARTILMSMEQFENYIEENDL